MGFHQVSNLINDWYLLNFVGCYINERKNENILNDHEINRAVKIF